MRERLYDSRRLIYTPSNPSEPLPVVGARCQYSKLKGRNVMYFAVQLTGRKKYWNEEFVSDKPLDMEEVNAKIGRRNIGLDFRHFIKQRSNELAQRFPVCDNRLLTHFAYIIESPTGGWDPARVSDLMWAFKHKTLGRFINKYDGKSLADEYERLKGRK